MKEIIKEKLRMLNERFDSQIKYFNLENISASSKEFFNTEIYITNSQIKLLENLLATKEVENEV